MSWNEINESAVYRWRTIYLSINRRFRHGLHALSGLKLMQKYTCRKTSPLVCSSWCWFLWSRLSLWWKRKKHMCATVHRWGLTPPTAAVIRQLQSFSQLTCWPTILSDALHVAGHPRDTTRGLLTAVSTRLGHDGWFIQYYWHSFLSGNSEFLAPLGSIFLGSVLKAFKKNLDLFVGE